MSAVKEFEGVLSESLSANGTAPRPQLISASDYEIEQVTWRWKGRIAAGMISVLDGDPGLGKSTITTDIVARTTLGEPLPGDGIGNDPADAIMISYEDAPRPVMVPRLMAARANLSRVHLWDAPRFSLPDSLSALEAAVIECDVKLVVIDPLMAALSAQTNSNNDSDIRRVLAEVAAMCERTGCAVLFVRHLNKRGEGRAIYRGGGSIGIIGAARVGLLLERDPDDEDARVLAVTKCNLGPMAPSLKLKTVSATVYTADDKPIEVGTAQWNGVANRTADELVEDPEDLTAADEAEQFIRELLASGPVLAKDAQKAVNEAGYGTGTVARAKRKLKICSKRKDPTNMKSPWWWVAPGQSLPGG